jgi:uncharacterized protein YbcV (DUF1398 family)
MENIEQVGKWIVDVEARSRKYFQITNKIYIQRK